MTKNRAIETLIRPWRKTAAARRIAALAGLVALALTGYGDGVRAAYTIQGIDPLGVLELKVRPNVIVVLDTSGSMQDRSGAGSGGMWGGDYPRSKMYIAKQVLKDVVRDNQAKVSFLFGSYSQAGSALQGRAAGNERFRYVVNSLDAPSMAVAATELKVIGQLGAGGSPVGARGLQAWQDIQAGWNTLVYRETRNTTTTTCTISVPVGFYRTGAALATELQTRMNSCTRPATANTYRVTFDTANGRFTFARSTATENSFTIRWADGTNGIRGALGMYNAANSANNINTKVTNDSYILLQRGAGFNMSETFDPDGSAGTLPSQLVYFYNLRAGRFWNGETVRVTAAGAVCGIDPPGARTPPVKPSVFLQPVDNTCGSAVGDPVEFVLAGGEFGQSNVSCKGFQTRAQLVPCDIDTPPAPYQFDTIFPFIDDEFQVNAATDGSPKYYGETSDGAYASTWSPPSGTGTEKDSLKADGYTPIANSLNHIKRAFTELWNTGQTGATTMVGPPPYSIPAIRNHADPKERTIVLFVTDGDDTCPTVTGGGNTSNMDTQALRAARMAERLYDPTLPNWAVDDANDDWDVPARTMTDYTYVENGVTKIYEAARVQTYMIGYGGAFAGGVPTRLNWIAWGGSGMKRATTGTGADGQRWNTAPTATDKKDCPTCVDAIVAPDGEALKNELQSIIDQGASEGEFSASGGGAASSITETIWEYVDRAPDFDDEGEALPPYDPRDPFLRYRALAPTAFTASFTLPGFRGQVKAYQNSMDASMASAVDEIELAWNAGDKLHTAVTSGMLAACVGAAADAPALAGECAFGQLTGGVEYTDIASSSAGIKRRAFTTSQNGYFGVTATNLMSGSAPYRVALWPPQSASLATPVDPANSSVMGLLDGALGLPLTATTTIFTSLQDDYGACTGTPLPTACASTTVATRVGAARKEARQMVLAFMAGAEVSRNSDGTPKRVASGSRAREILYKARPWMLAETTLATAAVVGPPGGSGEPVEFLREFALYRDGVRDGTGANPDAAGSQIKMGFGLRNPDADGPATLSGVIDGRLLKPVMTVLYLGANDGLHAFRAAPNCTPSWSACAETGGEELWLFVPFDQLGKLNQRLVNDPETRKNHTFMIARGLRFGDVFVRERLTDARIGGVTYPSLEGVWRKVLLFGRGAGGKHVTALDITAPGVYSSPALTTNGPIPLWNRGNPDTVDGTTGGTRVNGSADFDAYLRMGETWSVPALAYAGPFYSVRKPRPEPGTVGNPVDFVALMGSGFGAGAEGSAIFTLDALTGDVVRTAVIAPKTGQPTGNAVVAPVVTYNALHYQMGATAHLASSRSSRAYVGDLHGQVWKILFNEPQGTGSDLQTQTAIKMADLSVDRPQPIGTSFALLGLPSTENPVTQPPVPHIYGTTGNDSRYDGPFGYFALRDEGNDTQTTTSGPVARTGIETWTPATVPEDSGGTPFVPHVFDSGTGGAEPCEGDPLDESLFRGDVQPLTTLDCGPVASIEECSPAYRRGVVFFAANRLNLPNTRFAPPTPLKYCMGVYPCRSSFDSIVYAVGAKSGGAAFNLGSGTAYQIFYNSRTGALSAQPDPDMGGTRLTRDETLVKPGIPPPPPPEAGIPPVVTMGSQNVIPGFEAGMPVPSVAAGSTVCR